MSTSRARGQWFSAIVLSRDAADEGSVESMVGFITARLTQLAESDPKDRLLLGLSGAAADRQRAVYILTLGTVPSLRQQVGHVSGVTRRQFEQQTCYWPTANESQHAERGDEHAQWRSSRNHAPLEAQQFESRFRVCQGSMTDADGAESVC